jgi:MFS superfamily sulfate permease-like transporter
MDYDFFKNIRSTPKSDIIVMLTVLLITVFCNLIAAVGTGVVLHVIFKKACAKMSVT